MDVEESCHDGAALAASVTDDAAFACVVRRHYPTVYRYLSRRAGADVADDLAAATFEIAFRRRADFDATRATALPWLYGIATNELRGHARSERRRWRAYARSAPEPQPADEYSAVDDRLVAQAQARALAGALVRLTVDQRDVVHLIALEGLSYDQAALALDVPVGTVRSRLARAREELRRHLRDDVDLGLRTSPPPESGTP
jgi:RNA polymerase sigma factor (sigma-70 family)